MGVMTGCKLRKEVLKGDLDDAIFAADFGDLIAGKAPKVYQDPRTFFQNTHPAKQLSKIVRAVSERLASDTEGGATIRLSTGFGGGKTHTLMALWHLGNNISDLTMGTELLPAAGRPKNVTVIAVDAGKGSIPEFAMHGKTRIHSLWGEIFFQMGGEKALKALGKADDPEASPNERQIEAALPNGPVLVLLDELVVYMARLNERGQGNLMGFITNLAAVVTKRHQAVLVVTDPAGQASYDKEAAGLAKALPGAAEKLDEIFGRKMTDFDPIGEESAQVIVRRLFEKVDANAAQAASATYFNLYRRVAQETPGAIPPSAASADYAKQIVACYPFHPRLLETARDRLGALQDFQKSRGVLRLFARILRDIWEAKEDVELISAGEINWSSSRIQADLLQRLNRDNFKAAVSADIEKHAAELDGESPRGVHRRAASALLLESLSMQPTSGLDRADLTLAILRPEEAGPEPAEALDRLLGVCWHTYPMPGSRGRQFRYDANIIKQIEERKSSIPMEDARSRVIAEAQEYFKGPAFKLVPWPANARQVPESAELQLALCENEKISRSVCAYADDSDPAAPIPRRFQNAIIAVTATPSAFNNAVDRAQRLLAAETIERDYKTGESGKLVREQLQRVKPELQKQFRIQTCRAFDRIVLAGSNAYSIEEQFQVSDEQMLQKAHGQSCVRKFLDSKGLIYQPEDALDVARFIKDLLPGTTPSANMLEVYTAKAVHERFLGAPKLRLIPDGSIVRRTILKSIEEGKIVVRLADGRVYDSKGCVEGPEGKRRRIPGTLTSFALDDSVYLTTSGNEYGIQWVKEDKPEFGKPEVPPPFPPPPPSNTRVTATSWDRIIELARERPLLKLELIAIKPAAADALTALVQPLGADSISLSVSVSGALKDNGNMNFAANDVKLNHPTRPLGIAQTVFSALVEGSVYQAVVSLWFGAAGRTGLDSQLSQLSEQIPDDVNPRADFDKPSAR